MILKTEIENPPRYLELGFGKQQTANLKCLIKKTIL